MPEEIVVRAADWKEVRATSLINFYFAGRPDSWTPVGIDGDPKYLLAEENGSAVGLPMGHRKLDHIAAPIKPGPRFNYQGDLQELHARAKGTWFIEGMSVRHDMPGRGIGKTLLNAAEERAEQSRASGVSVVVPENLTQFQAKFFEANGFVLQGEGNGYYSIDAQPVKWLLLIKDYPNG